jgi:peptidoglycan hydrolase-like protein with peptidoglycan-binding domain
MVVDKPPRHPEVRQGSSGDEVRLLQERLNTDGASPQLLANGVFDGATGAALQAFQGRHGLDATGVAELRTWGVLDELARHGIAGPTATLGGVVPVSQEEHDAVDAILRGHAGPGGAGPAMTGIGPGGAYEKMMFDALAVPLGAPLADHGTTMEHADRIGLAAQGATERVFGAAITLASRTPDGAWHPGSCKQGLREASTRQLSDQEIRQWTDYLMDSPSYPGAGVNQFHYYDSSRPADRTEHDRVRDAWLGSGGRQRVIDMVRSWPAEAGSGTVYLELRNENYQGREGMWRLFATLLHEFQHLVTHPNYDDVADAIGGMGRSILHEGITEYMRFTVWAEVLKDLAANEELRQIVEGPYFDAHASADDYAENGPVDKAARADYYDEWEQADKIVDHLGDANAHAAFFMGHVEALGLQGWLPGGNAEPGIRRHTAIAQDTRGQVATQNGITQALLERANSMQQAPATTPVAAGTVLLIPVG